MWHLPIIQWIWESIKTIYLAAKWLYEKYIYKFVLKLAFHLQKVWKFVYAIWDKVYKKVKEFVDLIDSVYDKATGYIDKVKEKVDEVIDKVMREFMLNDTYVEEYLKGKIDHYYYQLLEKFNEFWAGKVEPFFGVARSLQHDLLMFKKKYLDTTARILNRIIQQEKVMEAIKEFKDTFLHTTIMNTIHQTETSASYFWEYAPSTGTVPSAVAGMIVGWSPMGKGPVVHFSEGATLHYPDEWPSDKLPYVIWKDGKRYDMRYFAEYEEGGNPHPKKDDKKKDKEKKPEEIDMSLKFEFGPDLCLDPRARLPGRSTITDDPKERKYVITEEKEAAITWNLNLKELYIWTEDILERLTLLLRNRTLGIDEEWDGSITTKNLNHFLTISWKWIWGQLKDLSGLLKSRSLKEMTTCEILLGIKPEEEEK